MYKAKEKIVVMDGRIYDLQALKSAELKKRDANAFLCVYSGLTCFTLKDLGLWGEMKGSLKTNHQNMRCTYSLSKPVA